jgi:hypothetical protein
MIRGDNMWVAAAALPGPWAGMHAATRRPLVLPSRLAGTLQCLPPPALHAAKARAPRSRRSRRPPHRSAVVGEVDEEADSNIDYTQVRAAPLKAILH